MLWISSMIAMLLEKVLPRWHRTLNILAPIVINGVLVLLALYAQVELSYNIPNFIEDFLCLCLLVSLIFVIIVWLINTIIVLRTIARTKEKK
jgi:predicted Na+-dependent transporter